MLFLSNVSSLPWVQLIGFWCVWSPGVSGPGPAPPLPLSVSSGLRGPAGLPASAVCHRVGLSEAHGPGWRQRRGDHLSDGCRLHSAVPTQKLHSALLGSGCVCGAEWEEEYLQCLQVKKKKKKVTALLHDRHVMDGWSINIDGADALKCWWWRRAAGNLQCDVMGKMHC